MRPVRLQHAQFCKSKTADDPSVEEKAQHAVPTATTMFRLSNPEAFMDPNKRISWVVTGVVAAFLAARLAYAAYQDSGAPPARVEPILPAEVLKELPDGRLLMKDGSIQRPKG